MGRHRDDPERLAFLRVIGRGLRDERVARGWSQRTLANVADVDQAFISRLERGMTPGARFDRIARVLYALEWPVNRRNVRAQRLRRAARAVDGVVTRRP